MTEITEDRNDPIASKMSKIRKLLAKAEVTDSEAEKDALNTRAAELMAQYGIEHAMLEDEKPGGDKITDEVIPISRPFAADFRDLLWRIAKPLGLRGVLTRSWNQGEYETSLRLFGYSSDITRAKVLYGSLRNQALHGLGAVRGDWNSSQAANKRQYLNGFGAAVYRRLLQAEAEAAQAEQERQELEQSTSRDLALLEGITPEPQRHSVTLVLAGRKERVDAAFTTAYPGLSKSKARNLSGNGYRDGYRAGQRASLGTAKGVGTGPKSIRLSGNNTRTPCVTLHETT